MEVPEREGDPKELLQRLQRVRLEDTIDETAREIVDGIESEDPERRRRAEKMLDCQNFIYNLYKPLVEAAASGTPEFAHSDEEFMNISVLGGKLMEKYGPGDLLEYGLELQCAAYLGATWFMKLRARAERVKQEEEQHEEYDEEPSLPTNPIDVQARNQSDKPTSPLR